MMSLLAALLSVLALVVATLGILIYQWVTLVPQLGYSFVYHIQFHRVVTAAVAVALAILPVVTLPSTFGWGCLLLTVLLTPLSGATKATHFLVAMDDPQSGKGSDAPLADGAMVLGTEINGQAHAWAVESLFPHHIINEQVGGMAISATWCAYCHSGNVYNATVRGQRLHFYPEAVWRRNMIMRDQETGTLWQQATGEALAGQLKGTQLELLGGSIMNWGEWKQQYPATTLALEPEKWTGIMSRKDVLKWTGIITPQLRLPGRVNDKRLPFTEEIVGVVIKGEAKAYATNLIRQRHQVNDTVGGITLRLSFDETGNRVCIDSANGPVPFKRELWLGWCEFHPYTGVYK